MYEDNKGNNDGNQQDKGKGVKFLVKELQYQLSLQELLIQGIKISFIQTISADHVISPRGIYPINPLKLRSELDRSYIIKCLNFN